MCYKLGLGREVIVGFRTGHISHNVYIAIIEKGEITSNVPFEFRKELLNIKREGIM